MATDPNNNNQYLIDKSETNPVVLVNPQYNDIRANGASSLARFSYGTWIHPKFDPNAVQ